MSNGQNEREAWKCGDEFAPYHPDASHVSPDYRDGWNHCYRAALASKQAPEGMRLVPVELLRSFAESSTDANARGSADGALASAAEQPQAENPDGEVATLHWPLPESCKD